MIKEWLVINLLNELELITPHKLTLLSLSFILYFILALILIFGK